MPWGSLQWPEKCERTRRQGQGISVPKQIPPATVPRETHSIKRNFPNLILVRTFPISDREGLLFI